MVKKWAVCCMTVVMFLLIIRSCIVVAGKKYDMDYAPHFAEQTRVANLTQAEVQATAQKTEFSKRMCKIKELKYKEAVKKWEIDTQCCSYDMFLETFGQPTRYTRGESIILARWGLVGTDYIFRKGCCTNQLSVEMREKVTGLKYPIKENCFITDNPFDEETSIFSE
jgi:hypothetical protein